MNEEYGDTPIEWFENLSKTKIKKDERGLFVKFQNMIYRPTKTPLTEGELIRVECFSVDHIDLRKTVHVPHKDLTGHWISNELHKNRS